MKDNKLQESQKWLEDHSKGVIGSELVTSTLEGLQVVASHEGFFRCHFLVPSSLLDQRGNWHIGAIATLIDSVGAATAHSLFGPIRASVDFIISYFSTAKFQEEIEIEAKAVRGQGKLVGFMVEVKRKGSGELIAIGKQWMASKGQEKSSRL
ncbi:uncharacterized protein LOC21408890 [Morus notabilis]|uniref:uncharacterized protein LOC21408890 n=1 Tax=Morus notabilis TaxID=981085 RepID=UPI000CED67F5|nr:uncharacterized protein LOC21408890 [Morus notabilis]